MTGEAPSNYFVIMWRFVCPILMFMLFASSVIKSTEKAPTYIRYDKESVCLPLRNLTSSSDSLKPKPFFSQAKLVETQFPAWSLYIALSLVFAAIAPLLIVFFVRKFKIIRAEPNIPAVSLSSVMHPLLLPLHSPSQSPLDVRDRGTVCQIFCFHLNSIVDRREKSTAPFHDSVLVKVDLLIFASDLLHLNERTHSNLLA